MLEADFLERLQALVSAQVEGMDRPGKADILAGLVDDLRREQTSAACAVVPFMPGRRPTDEAAHPGLGSSDEAALILSDEDPGAPGNRAFVLFSVQGARPGDELDVTLRFSGVDGSETHDPIPGWDRRPLTPRIFTTRDDGPPALTEVDIAATAGHRLVLAVDPQADLLGEDVFAFGHLFAQWMNVGLRLTRNGVPVAGAQTRVFCADERRFGSLYERVVERLLAPDTARQAQAAGEEDPGVAYHPWYPVLRIGREKAALYTRGLKADIVGKECFLPDPGWLLRVGLYLELLTCIGIFEAVSDDARDLLTPEERHAYETSPLFAEIRRRVNPAGWRACWDLQEIAFPRLGTPRTGPVSALNLLNKRKATLTFLHVHHLDLRHAIELAGTNHVDAQETWQRVFRDAERAVLRQTTDAFPELGFVSESVREFVLWHRQGEFELGIRLRVPIVFSRLFADQDGLYTSACRQYRASMNEVADWAKANAVMDHTGAECVPVLASLLEAHFAGSARVGALQAHDGYREPLLVGAALPEVIVRTHAEIVELIADAPVFRALSRDELSSLVASARPIELGPLERFVVQGRQGTSLFVVADGTVEVLLRREDGADWPVATMERGAIVGEMSLLTGEPRSATVRAVDGGLVYEIGKRQYEPILRARPELVDEIAVEIGQRLDARRERLQTDEAALDSAALRTRIRRFLLGQ